MSEGDGELIQKLEDYAYHDGTEMGEYWSALLNLHRQSAIPDDLARVLMEQVRQEVEFAEANATVVTEESTVTRRRLQWNDDI